MASTGACGARQRVAASCADLREQRVARRRRELVDAVERRRAAGGGRRRRRRTRPTPPRAPTGGAARRPARRCARPAPSPWRDAARRCCSCRARRSAPAPSTARWRRRSARPPAPPSLSRPSGRSTSALDELADVGIVRRIDHRPARGRPVDALLRDAPAGERVEQRRFAGAGGADERDHRGALHARDLPVEVGEQTVELGAPLGDGAQTATTARPRRAGAAAGESSVTRRSVESISRSCALPVRSAAIGAWRLGSCILSRAAALRASAVSCSTPARSSGAVRRQRGVGERSAPAGGRALRSSGGARRP